MKALLDLKLSASPTTVDVAAALRSEGAKNIFIAYCHADESLRDTLENHLSALKREGRISCWHDRRISSGTEWKGEIDKNIERADIVLLLVSASFLASDYCCDVELKKAMQRHEEKSAIVLPVILRACDWHSTAFGKLQALPKDGKAITSWPNQDEAFLDVVRGIRGIVNR